MGMAAAAGSVTNRSMELRQLRHFMAVGEAGSITAAARKLRLTQPALSRQIKALEEELGTALLERGAHSVTVTPAGALLMAEGGTLLRAADALIEKVRVSAIGEPLRVGYAPSLAGEFLAVAIARFTQCHPRLRISLFDVSSAEMRSGLATGKLDLAVGAAPAGGNDPIHWVPLRDYGWRVVMPDSHPLAKKKEISPRDLAGERLLLYERENYPEYWDRITGYFRACKLQAKVAGEFDGVHSLMAALEANLGIALMAESSPIHQGHHRSLVIKPLTTQPCAISVSAGVSAESETPAKILALIEELKRAARDTDHSTTVLPGTGQG
jgi:LysR family transcriptional regulator, benzoate and cis,cis-muconate-responsive activator of ben and cat genes